MALKRKIPKKTIRAAELKRAYGLLGSKLGFFVASLDIEEETRGALLAILPKMTLPQLERFVATLEAQYLQQATDDMDKRFEKELSNLYQEFEKKQEQIDAKARKALKAIQKKIA